MRKRFILVVDTNEVLVGILREELATTTYALLHAKDGQEALDYLELLKSDIALAIIDFELPVLSGLDVIWHLVRQKHSRHTKIIATSHVQVPTLKNVVTKLGVDAVVRVPMPSQRWRKTINTVLGGNFDGEVSSGAVGI
jgi:two-component system cell cycle response regulator